MAPKKIVFEPPPTQDANLRLLAQARCAPSRQASLYLAPPRLFARKGLMCLCAKKRKKRSIRSRRRVSHISLRVRCVLLIARRSLTSLARQSYRYESIVEHDNSAYLALLIRSGTARRKHHKLSHRRIFPKTRFDFPPQSAQCT